VSSCLVCLNDWASAVESVTHLGLPWRMLRCQLVPCKTNGGMIDYHEWFDELAIKGPNADVSHLAAEVIESDLGILCMHMLS